MDFVWILHFIIAEFNNEKIRYALIGGFAMGAWGIMRSTMVLDFLVNQGDVGKIEDIMDNHGYNGQVDFIHAFRKISLSMLKRAVEVPVFEGKYEELKKEYGQNE